MGKPAPPAAEVAFLDQTTLARVANAWGVVHLSDGTHRQGIVIQTGQAPGGKYDYVILAAVPDSETRIDFATGSAKTEFFSAARKGRLENGLGLFGFSSTVRLDGFKRHAATPGIQVHAIRNHQKPDLGRHADDSLDQGHGRCESKPAPP